MLQDNQTGIVSFTYKGEERALCDSGFTQNSAEVVCLELYGKKDVLSFSKARPCSP